MLSHAIPLGLISFYGDLVSTEKRPGEGGIRTLVFYREKLAVFLCSADTLGG
jgi:hypothetical protein